MNIILFDHPKTKTNLLPFTFTRPISDIRIGILTIKEKWEKWLPTDYSYLPDDYLSKKFTLHKVKENLYLNGSVLPNSTLVEAVKALKKNQLLLKDHLPIAFFGNTDSVDELDVEIQSKARETVFYSHEIVTVQNVYDIFIKNGAAIRSDFDLLTTGRKSYPITDSHTAVYNPSDIFLEENVNIKFAVLNAEKGPIYIGANAEIGEGSIVKGAASIAENSTLNLGARLRGDVTIGPYSKVGGEISNSIVFGYSNKAHEGFMGNSVLGEWCNLGADTNTSNLKNNYKNIRIWNYGQERFVDTGRQFCGLMMGDHSMSGINTMFNTGTVVGVSTNIFGGGFPRTFIPSFSQGGAKGFSTYHFEMAYDVIGKVFERRKKSLRKVDVDILKHIFEVTKKYRSA